VTSSTRGESPVARASRQPATRCPAHRLFTHPHLNCLCVAARRACSVERYGQLCPLLCPLFFRYGDVLLRIVERKHDALAAGGEEGEEEEDDEEGGSGSSSSAAGGAGAAAGSGASGAAGEEDLEKEAAADDGACLCLCLALGTPCTSSCLLCAVPPPPPCVH